MLAMSKSVEFALIANKIAYLGSVFLPMAILMNIFDISHLKYKKILPLSLAVLAFLMFGLICTTGYLPWYYKEATLVFESGASRLVKEYGPAHVSYLIYLVLYFVAMVAVIIYVFAKKRVSNKQSILLAMVVFGNIAVWGMEQFLDINFEFLSISYLLSELLFLGIQWLMQDVEKNILQRKVSAGEELSIDEQVSLLLSRLSEEESLTAREKEILCALLMNKKRKEMAKDFSVSENTIKTHVTHIYNKFGVAGKTELQDLINGK